MHRLHQDERIREEHLLGLDEIARLGARRMLAEALEAEVEFYIETARGERDERGHALVTRNGYARERQVLLGAGAVEVKAPRVNDRRVDEDGNRQRFKSVILPPYMRRSPKVTEVLPLLYLHGRISMVSPAVTLFRLWRSSSARRRGCLRRPSPDSPSAGNPRGRAS